MRIQVVSDLHLEFDDVVIPNGGADVLVLSGDIATAKSLGEKTKDSVSDGKLFMRYRDFFTRVSRDFAHVVYVAGNHEFYGSTYETGLRSLRNFCASFDNVYFLDDAHIDIEDTRFIGATLWTDVNRGNPLYKQYAKDGMNDYHSIRVEASGTYRKMKPDDTIERHIRSLSYICDRVREHDKCVVATHHAPTAKSVQPEWVGHALTPCYYSDLDFLIMDRPAIKLWTHGHIHASSDYMVEGCRVVANPRGYVKYEPRARTWQGIEAIIEI